MNLPFVQNRERQLRRAKFFTPGSCPSREWKDFYPWSGLRYSFG